MKINLLTDDLPNTLLISGKEYRVRTDFRTCLKTILAFEDTSLTYKEKSFVLLANMFEDAIPSNLVQEALHEAIRFLDCGDEEDTSGIIAPRIYSFDHDSNLIYAAFKQTHDVNLNNSDLHWYQFVALFMDLAKDSTFLSIVSLRKKIKSGKYDKEDLKLARELGSLYTLPEEQISNLTPEEQANVDLFYTLLEGKQNG